MKRYWVQLNRPQTMLYLTGSLCLIGSIILLCQFCGIMLCPLRRYTGIPCFTCGSTRAILAFLSGDFRTAFLTQPLIVSLFCLMAPVALFSLFTALFQKRIFLITFSRMEQTLLFCVLIVAALLNWLYLLSTNM